MLLQQQYFHRVWTINQAVLESHSFNTGVCHIVRAVCLGTFSQVGMRGSWHLKGDGLWECWPAIDFICFSPRHWEKGLQVQCGLPLHPTNIISWIYGCPALLCSALLLDPMKQG